MTVERRESRASLWVILPVVLTAGLVALDLGDRFWAPAQDSRITSYQVSQLTGAVKELAGKFDAMPKQAALDALVSRIDKDQTDQQTRWDRISQTFNAVGDRFNKIERSSDATDGHVSALTDRVARLEAPAGTYRNPPKCPGC